MTNLVYRAGKNPVNRPSEPILSSQEKILTSYTTMINRGIEADYRQAQVLVADEEKGRRHIVGHITADYRESFVELLENMANLYGTGKTEFKTSRGDKMKFRETGTAISNLAIIGHALKDESDSRELRDWKEKLGEHVRMMKRDRMLFKSRDAV